MLTRVKFQLSMKNLKEYKLREARNYITDGGTEGVETAGTAGAGFPGRGSYPGKDSMMLLNNVGK